MPRFSIVTVSYNSVPTISDTVESVSGKGRRIGGLEHIIIDGGSTDGTVEVIQRYESDLAHWVSEPDDGIYDAMNKGIQKATGHWIGTLNADDWYAPDALQHVASVARDHPEAGVIIGGMVRVSDDGLLGKVKPPFRGGFSTLKSNNHPATFVRRSVYESVGSYDTAFRVAADLDWLARAMDDPSVKTVTTDEVITFMRGGGASANFVGVFESFRVEKRHRGVGTAVTVFAVKFVKMLAYKLAHLLLPKRLAHALERAFWRWRFEVVDMRSDR